MDREVGPCSFHFLDLNPATFFWMCLHSHCKGHLSTVSCRRLDSPKSVTLATEKKMFMNFPARVRAFLRVRVTGSRIILWTFNQNLNENHFKHSKSTGICLGVTSARPKDVKGLCSKNFFVCFNTIFRKEGEETSFHSVPSSVSSSFPMKAPT